jgi:uncharacterized membrane protein YeaQ/YmgE (transglycosylase-associated protein family)
MRTKDLRTSPRVCLLRQISFVVLILTALCYPSIEARAAESVSEKVRAVASDAGKQITDASKAAESKIQELWQRIDERRLKNRTPDQLVGWFIMGLLAGGLIHQFSKLHKLTTLLLGLAGALVGGILANVIQLDLGLGPVLIRYEDLVASLGGAVLIVLVWRWLAARKAKRSVGK